MALLTAGLTAGGMWLALRPGGSGPTGDGRTVTQANPAAPDWSVTAATVAPSVVSIQVMVGSSGGRGSGVIFDAAGHVMTNNHVVDTDGETAKITVTLADKRSYTGKVVGTDPATDLAVLKLENAPGDLKPIAFGDDTKLRVGDPVMAVGNPLGLSGTVTTGIISALNRPVATGGKQSSSAADAVVTNAVQTSAAINPGNSGGALVNASGQLIGINSSIAALPSSSGEQSGNIGIGFAIPSNEVKHVTEDLIANGTVKHAFLGVTPADGVVRDGNDKRAAAVINAVSASGPAAAAGVQKDDAVIAVDGEAVDGALSLIAQIRERRVGDQVLLTIVRDGQRKEMRVKLGERS